MSMFEIYKPGQGKYTRMSTLIGVLVVGFVGMVELSSALRAWLSEPYVRFGLPTLLFIALGLLMFWLVNRQRSADFLIATESEMKKVSWSSRKEIVGSTKVVLVTTFVLAGILAVVDLLFTMLFKTFGIMG